MLDSKSVGRAIQKAREKRGVSQEVLSSFADIGRTHLSAIECGARRPTLDTFFKISEALNMRASDLMKMVEDELQSNDM